MAYEFTGIFVRQDHPGDVNRIGQSGLEVRPITDPFSGVGVKLGRGSSASLPVAAILDRVTAMGISHQSWMYIECCCFGGQLDLVRGIVSKQGVVLDLHEDDSLDTVEATFLDLMADFGVSEQDAQAFKPFERGFWSEDR